MSLSLKQIITNMAKPKKAPAPAPAVEPEISLTLDKPAAPKPGQTEVALEDVLNGAPMNPMYIERVNQIIMDNYEKSNRVLNLTGEIDIDNPEMANVLRWLNFWDDGTERPVYIYISSHGGDCNLGLAIADSINNLKSHKIPVFTINVSCASSMAAVIFACGSEGCRYSYPSARLMFHQCRYGGMFDIRQDEAKIAAKELEVFDKYTIDLLVEITGKTRDEVKQIIGHDAYFSAAEAKKLKIVNKISVLTV